jgi:hypothetical protein
MHFLGLCWALVLSLVLWGMLGLTLWAFVVGFKTWALFVGRALCVLFGG